MALQEIANGLAFPLYLTAPAGDPRLFIVEKGGAIRILKDGVLLPAPFLNLTGLVSTGNEQGLLGLAFPPDYAGSGRFFVHYTDLAGDTRVSSFQVSADADVADPASEVLVLAADQPFDNHNGGQIAFGPDEMLWIGTGDGGDAWDPWRAGQDQSSLLAKLLLAATVLGLAAVNRRDLTAPVLAGDEAHAVDAAQVAVHEAVARLGVVVGAVGQGQVPGGEVVPGVRLEVGVLVVGTGLGVAPLAAQDVLAGVDEPARLGDAGLVDRIGGHGPSLPPGGARETRSPPFGIGGNLSALRRMGQG